MQLYIKVSLCMRNDIWKFRQRSEYSLIQSWEIDQNDQPSPFPKVSFTFNDLTVSCICLITGSLFWSFKFSAFRWSVTSVRKARLQNNLDGKLPFSFMNELMPISKHSPESAIELWYGVESLPYSPSTLPWICEINGFRSIFTKSWCLCYYCRKHNGTKMYHMLVKLIPLVMRVLSSCLMECDLLDQNNCPFVLSL